MKNRFSRTKTNFYFVTIIIVKQMTLYEYVIKYKLEKYNYCSLLSPQTTTFLFDLTKKNLFLVNQINDEAFVNSAY
jgi:hypothetical protein